MPCSARPAAALRLVTCTGTFDRARGSYRDNLVVFPADASASGLVIAWSRGGAQRLATNGPLLRADMRCRSKDGRPG
jgi:hypothetical protein